VSVSVSVVCVFNIVIDFVIHMLSLVDLRYIIYIYIYNIVIDFVIHMLSLVDPRRPCTGVGRTCLVRPVRTGLAKWSMAGARVRGGACPAPPPAPAPARPCPTPRRRRLGPGASRPWPILPGRDGICSRDRNPPHHHPPHPKSKSPLRRFAGGDRRRRLACEPEAVARARRRTSAGGSVHSQCAPHKQRVANGRSTRCRKEDQWRVACLHMVAWYGYGGAAASSSAARPRSASASKMMDGRGYDGLAL
jgi:hypothetical protein